MLQYGPEVPATLISWDWTHLLIKLIAVPSTVTIKQPRTRSTKTTKSKQRWETDTHEQK